MAPPCILIVDDQRDIVRLIHASLQTLGHDLELVDAPSGEEALLVASQRKVSLLVADYLLPGISGVELMRKIKVRNPELKTIFISGYNERKARNEMLQAGGVAIFDKPIPMADFLDAVERSLGLVRTIFPPEIQHGNGSPPADPFGAAGRFSPEDQSRRGLPDQRPRPRPGTGRRPVRQQHGSLPAFVPDGDLQCRVSRCRASSTRITRIISMSFGAAITT